jgi:GDSL-like Lipase/Acylhydrolase family
MSHIVLLGDSIFDNAAYVAGGPDVVTQLRDHLPAGSRATLRAVDGATVSDLRRQVERMPQDATHLIVSVGGNDALGHIGVLEDRANSIAAALDRLADIRARFDAEYRTGLEHVLACGLKTALCTIYEPRFPDPHLQRLGVTGLTIFNDCILRHAFRHALPVLDLRLIYNEDQDYANAIEPSVAGGDKIARAIARLVARHDFSHGRSSVFGE